MLNRPNSNLRGLLPLVPFLIAAPILVFQITAQTLRTPASDASAQLAQAVRPFIQKNCEGCHNSGLPSGNVDFQQLLSTPNSLAARHDTWEDVAYQIRSGTMPPEGAAKPAKEDADQALELISRAVATTPRANAPAVAQKEEPATNDWLTYSYDPERTGWDRAETKITKSTAANLQLRWRLQLQMETAPDLINKYSTLTEPVVVNNVPTGAGPKKMLFVASRDNTVYAIDADKGTVVWKRSYPNNERPPVAESGICPNNLNATPVVDRQSGILYFLPNDGKLRGVNISDGEDRFPATSMVPPYSRGFSLNLSEGRIVTGTARGCANAISGIHNITVTGSEHPVSHFYTSTGKASGPWGRGGIVRTPFGWLTQTADGAYDPASGRWGISVLGFSEDGRLTDSFTPADEPYIDGRDLDLGSSSPVVFPFGDRTLVASSGKQGVIYLLDAKNLGGKDHRTPLYQSPRWSNDAELLSYNGMWSVLSTYVDAQGKRWLLAPFYGPSAKATIGQFPKTHGDTINGQLMAFTVEGTGSHPTLKPQWVSADLDLPGVAVIASGVILILADGDRGATLVPTPGRGGAAGRGGGGGPRTLPLIQVNPAVPGFERDEAWATDLLRPFEEGGQKGGTRYSGGRDTTHAVLYALDPATGDELYSSGNAMDSWNHYGGLALSDGNIYVSTWDARVFAFGLKKQQ